MKKLCVLMLLVFASAALAGTVPGAKVKKFPNMQSGPGQYEVTLTWTPNGANNIASQNIYRGTVSGGPYSQIVSGLSPSTDTYNDTSVTNGDTYYYVATCVDNNGNESTYSNQAGPVTIPNPPNPPTNLAAKVVEQ